MLKLNNNDISTAHKTKLQVFFLIAFKYQILCIMVIHVKIKTKLAVNICEHDSVSALLSLTYLCDGLKSFE